jgi:DNA-binding NarL/FixJ family response regulator
MSDDSGRHTITVVVATNVRLYRNGLATSLAGSDKVSVVATSSDRGETLARVEALAPDVAIVDIAMRESLELIRDLRCRSDSTKIIAFGVEEVSSDILECAEAGAAGYVTADASLDTLVQAIEQISRDELVCPPQIAARLFKRIAEGIDRSPDGRDPQQNLTLREHQVLNLIGHGHSNKEIAQELNIAETTVKHHVHHLLKKLAVTTRAQAAARASLSIRRHPLSDHRWESQ